MKKIWSDREDALRHHLKTLRKNAGLSQVQLAEKLNKPQSFVSKYENGERQLRIIELQDVCKACGSTAPLFLEHFFSTIEL